MGVFHLPCMSHTLQLAVNKGLDVARINRCICHCKSVVTHFKKSTKEMYKLKENQKMLELPSYELVQNCATRWGNTLVMLERLMEKQAAITALMHTMQCFPFLKDENHA